MGSEIDSTYKMKYKDRPKKNPEEEKNDNNLNESKNEINNKNEEQINKQEEEKSIDRKGESIDKKTDDNKKEESIDKKEESNNNEDLNVKIKTIKVKIKVKDGFWEKEYNIDTFLNQIENDFKQENNLKNLKKNHYIEFIFNNSPLQMDFKALSSLVVEGQKELILFQEIKRIPGTEKEEMIEPVDFIGKPFFNPFEIYILDIKNKLIKKIKYGKEKLRKFEFDKFGINSAYCNGINNLFISGGEDPFTKEILNLFLIFDLKNNIPTKKMNMPLAKKNHNMIYINNKVYIIGGNDEQTMYYDIIKNSMEIWAKLNIKKYEPSLIKFDNYLFCIDSSKKYLSDYNFEKIDLEDNNPSWEVVKPKISPDASDLIFSQKFFGVIEDNNDNIIFIGGIYDDNIKNNFDENEFFSLQYNVNENLIEKSNINIKNNDSYKEIYLKEKAFLPFNKNIYVIFPDFSSRAPKILYYYKDKNELEINLYHQNQKLTKKYNKIRIASLQEKFKDLNFNMPHKNANIYSNDNNKNEKNKFDLEKSGINPAYKRYLGIHLKEKEKENNINILNNFKDISKDKENSFSKLDKNISKNKDLDNIIMKENEIINNNISNADINNIQINNNYNIDNNKINNIINNNVTTERKSSNDNKFNTSNNSSNKNKEDDKNDKKSDEIDKKSSKINNISEIKDENDNIEDNKKSEKSVNDNNINPDNNNNHIINDKLNPEKKSNKTSNNSDKKSNKTSNNEDKKSNKTSNNGDKKSNKTSNNEDKKSNKTSNNEDKKSNKTSNNEDKKSNQTSNKIDNEEKKEQEDKKSDEEEEKRKIEEEVKLKKLEEEKLKEKNKGRNKSSKKSETNIELFDYEKSYSLATFHSSVNNNLINNFGRLNNNKVINDKIKMRRIIQPKDVNVKTLKKARRQFNYFDMNEFRDNNNY